MRVIAILLVIGSFILGLGFLSHRNNQSIDQESEASLVHVSPERVYQLMTEPTLKGEKKPVVIDVRSPEEYALGHLPQAVNIPIENIEPGSKLPNIDDFNHPVILYSRSGSRADRAGRRLTLTGYKRLYVFSGIKHWPYPLATSPMDDLLMGEINDHQHSKAH